MTGLDMHGLLAQAERLLEQALARGADAAECYVEEARVLSVEIEAGRIAVTSADHSLGQSVRVVVDGRVGFASASGRDGAAAIDEAIASARHAKAEGYALPVPEAAPTKVDPWDPDLAAMAPGEAVEVAAELVRAWKDQVPDAKMPGGGVGVGAGAEAIATSMGIRAMGRGTSISASASLVHEGDATVHVWDSATSVSNDIDAAAVVGSVAERLKTLLRPEPAPWSGAYDIVLSPEAAAELVSSFIASSARGDEALRGNTRWSGMLGKQVADTRFTVHDDPLAPRAVGATGHDGEGLATARIPIIEEGVLRRYLFDSTDGHRHGQPSTASAQRDGFEARPSTGVHHMVFDHARRVDELVTEVDRGYYVDSLLGAHTANATTGDFSVTAPNVWAIEQGSLDHACTEIALSGSVPQLLASIDALSRREKQMDGARVPGFLVRSLQVAG